MMILAFHFTSSTEIIIILGVGVLLFGRRLPLLGRWLGRCAVDLSYNPDLRLLVIALLLFCLMLMCLVVCVWGLPSFAP
jgi:mttA/Hcf106 family